MAKPAPLSPLAPASFPTLAAIDGVRFASASAGVKYAGRTDVTLMVTDAGSSVAGVFTRSATRSAPVLDCQSKLSMPAPLDQACAILVNSGNSNAFTGRNGEGSVAAICAAVSAATGIPATRVFTASTGVIGERLPHDRITAKVDELVAGLGKGEMKDAAEAIRTTDTFAKGASVTIETDAGPIHISGIAKGSGMIAPDMATMLAYVFTDAKVDQPVLQTLLGELTETSFNAVTVDSDTSTSDSLMLVATNKGTAVDASNLDAFRDGLGTVLTDLAQQLARDGEGATKFITVKVTGAASQPDAKKVAMAIANSPLVKTAFAGEDPNWGRVVMAVGKSGAQADRDLLSIWFGDILVADMGWVSPDYSEEQGATYMKGSELLVRVDLALGDAGFTAWTCDLTHGYITINADYRS